MILRNNSLPFSSLCHLAQGWAGPSATFRFEFDGGKLRSEDTPTSAGVEEDDTIDAFPVLGN